MSDMLPDDFGGTTLPGQMLPTCRLLSPDGEAFVVNSKDKGKLIGQGWSEPGTVSVPEVDDDRMSYFGGLKVADLKDMYAFATSEDEELELPGPSWKKEDYVAALAASDYIPPQD